MRLKNYKKISFSESIRRYLYKNSLVCTNTFQWKAPDSLSGNEHIIIEDYFPPLSIPNFLLRMPKFIWNSAGRCFFNMEGELFRSKYIDTYHIEEPPWSWSIKCGDLEVGEPTHLLKGKTLYIGCFGDSEFYHFHSEVLGKIFVANQYFDILEFDHFAITNPLKGFQIDWFKRLGIEEKIIVLPNISLLFEDLYIPSFHMWSGQISKDLAFFLRGYAKPIDTKFKSLIYLSRRKAQTRRILNESELLNLIDKFGGDSVVLEDLSIDEQANLFSGATKIISAHGAGLTNLIYTTYRYSLLEMFTKEFVNACYFDLTNQLGGEYSYEVHDAVDQYRNDFHADIKSVITFLERTN